jgi:CRP/FNR family transcriptional regulator
MEHGECAVGTALYRFELVPGSPLFRGLDRDRLAVLRGMHGPQRRAERDTQLVRANEPAPTVLTLSSGWAFRYAILPDGRRQILSFSIPGDTIGLDALLTRGSTYPVQAANAVVYCAIPHERALGLVQQAGWFRLRALEALGRERDVAERALTRMGQCKAEEAVASILLEIYNRLAERGLAIADQFQLEFTQQQLADVVGLTVVHLNRTLGRLRSRGLVSVSGHRVTLLNVPELERLAVLTS